MSQKYFTVGWEQLHRDSKALAWRLAEKAPFRGIVAITRGGMIPAMIVLMIVALTFSYMRSAK